MLPATLGLGLLGASIARDTPSLEFRPKHETEVVYEHSVVLQIETTEFVVATVVDGEHNEAATSVSSKITTRESTVVKDAYLAVEKNRVLALRRSYEAGVLEARIATTRDGASLPARDLSYTSNMEGSSCPLLWDAKEEQYLVDPADAAHEACTANRSAAVDGVTIELTDLLPPAERADDGSWELPAQRFLELLAPFGPLYHLSAPESLPARPPAGTRSFTAFPPVAAGFVPLADVLRDLTGSITGRIVPQDSAMNDDLVTVEVSVDVRAKADVSNEAGLVDLITAYIPEGFELRYEHPIDIEIKGRGALDWRSSSGSFELFRFEGDVVIEETGTLEIATGMEPPDGPARIEVTQDVRWVGRLRVELQRK